MARQIPRPLSIKEVGFDVYLNQRAAIHNGWGYDDWIRFVGDDPSHPATPVAVIARLMRTSRATVYKWLREYKEFKKD